MTSTNKSLREIILSGDINTNEGQLGQTVFKSLTANAVMTPSTDFEDIYNKYVIDANGNYTLTLPGIQPTAGSFTANLVQLGFECIIVNNDDTNTLDVLEESTGARKVLLQPGESAKLIAEADNGVAEDDWVVILNSNGNCFTSDAAENLTADDIVDITNDGVIKANGVKLNNEIKSFGNVAPNFATSSFAPSAFTADSDNNIYYSIPIDASTTIGTDIRGNTVTITPGIAPFSLLFVKATLKGKIIWYRYCDFTVLPSSRTYSATRTIKIDANNNIVWIVGGIRSTGASSGFGPGTMSLTAHPYIGGDTASRQLRAFNNVGYLIGFNMIDGLLYDFDTVRSDTAANGACWFIDFDIDNTGDLYICGQCKAIAGVNMIFNNSTTGNILITSTFSGIPLNNTGQLSCIAKYISTVGFDKVITNKFLTAGDPGSDLFTTGLFLNKNQTHIFVSTQSNLRTTAVSYDHGRIYTSGGAATGVDSTILINIPAINIPNTGIMKLAVNTLEPVSYAMIDGITTGVYRFSYDSIRDQFLIRYSGSVASVLYEGSTTPPGTLFTNSTGAFIARIDTNLLWVNFNQTNNLFIPCQDLEGNFIMFGYTSSNVTIGGVNYPSGGLIFAKIDVNGNILISRRLSGNNINSNYMCPIQSINKKDTYYIHSGEYSSNITENGISLTTGGGSATQIFTYFVDSANSPLGVVVDDVTSGNPANICISGKYTMKNNTLVKGNDYFNDFGDITTNPIVKPKVGKSISTTDIILNLNK